MPVFDFTLLYRLGKSISVLFLPSVILMYILLRL
jgi:hypothetical protein